jgi:tryptophanyl-tRNA synthetase
MSKSYGNTIEMFEPEKTIKKKVMRIVTDSTPVEEPKDPDKCNVFALLKLLAPADESADWANRYRSGGMGYSEAKKHLAEHSQIILIMSKRSSPTAPNVQKQ